MKIRILGNSLRLRLSQTEVNQLASKEDVIETIRFGPSTRQVLTYSLSVSPMDEITAVFVENEIKVNLPKSMANNWAESDEVSLRRQIDIGNDETLNVLIEKDFKCMTERAGEDETDLFPHPNNDKEAC